MPMRRERYPADWPAISRRVREAAGNRCQWCGVANGAYGARDRHGVWHEANDIEGMAAMTGEQRFGADWDWKMTRIVLTVAHLDHDPANNSEANLAALCQRCHLRHDRALHLRNAAETRRRKRAAAVAATGQQELPV